MLKLKLMLTQLSTELELEPGLSLATIVIVSKTNKKLAETSQNKLLAKKNLHQAWLPYSLQVVGPSALLPSINIMNNQDCSRKYIYLLPPSASSE